MLGADGVGVDPGDEVLGRRLNDPRQLHALPLQSEAASGRLLLDLGAADALEAAEPVGLAVQHQHRVADPGRLHAGDLDPAHRHVEVVLGGAPLEPGALDPDPALGVLGAPVVADHAAPAVDVDPLAGDLEASVVDGVRVRAEELRLRQRRVVEEVAGQVVEGLVLVGEGEVPARRQRVGRDRARGAPVTQDRVADPDVGVVGRVELVRPELALGRARRRRRGVEEHEPEGAGDLLARALVDRVPDPGAPAPRPGASA